MSETPECADCGENIDTLLDTHYILSEEQRPVKELEDKEFDDWFNKNWFLCEECAPEVVNDGR